MQSYPHVFITVGTTEFQTLIDTINTAAVADILIRQLGCRQLTIQTGSSRLDGQILHQHYAAIETTVFDYAPSIREHIAAADLVISHAGAGTCIEMLLARKIAVVVVNETLMDNHQIELADRLFRDGHIFRCVPRELESTLSQDLRAQELRPYERGDAGRLVHEIDRLMNFVV